MAQRLAPALIRVLHRQEVALAGYGGRLTNWQQAQQKVLERGYVRVRDAAGTVLVAAAQVAAGSELSLEFHDGKVAARAVGGAAKTIDKDKPPPRGQGSLL